MNSQGSIDATSKKESQQSGYIMELHRLAETCNYGDLKDEMIHNRLVVGIHDDDALSQQLEMDAELTLEKAKKNPTARSCERTTERAQRSSRRSN